ncbi:MAG TPA: hypothetical protein PKN48_15645 [Bacteroidales bacterium]|nr:hypothetical protein [Bacteroidales bacterium]
MKNFIFLFLITLSFSVASQIPTIKAVGGAGTNILWAEEKMNTDPEGPGFFYNDCSQNVKPVSASSTLAPQGAADYDIKNLNDDDPMTAWIEGKPDYGIGEYFEIETPNVNTIYNGYQASPTTWKNNSRVKTFKVYKDNKPLCFLELTDEMGAQRFELPGETNYNYENPSIFKFEIVEIYKGLKWPDVAISHVDLVLCCFAENTNILGSTSDLPVSGIICGQNVYTVDINSGAISNTEIQKTTRQTHLSLLKIHTASKQIDVTPDHPLYIKNYGFISLSKILDIKGWKNNKDLINEIEILTWDDKSSKLLYEKLTGIELIHGVFETFSILKISRGSTFIANGFVTKTY